MKMLYEETLNMGELSETQLRICHRLECWRVPHTTGQHMVSQPT